MDKAAAIHLCEDNVSQMVTAKATASKVAGNHQLVSIAA